MKTLYAAGGDVAGSVSTVVTCESTCVRSLTVLWFLAISFRAIRLEPVFTGYLKSTSMDTAQRKNTRIGRELYVS